MEQRYLREKRASKIERIYKIQKQTPKQDLRRSQSNQRKALTKAQILSTEQFMKKRNTVDQAEEFFDFLVREQFPKNNMRISNKDLLRSTFNRDDQSSKYLLT